jgi:hypothetical protein
MSRTPERSEGTAITEGKSRTPERSEGTAITEGKSRTPGTPRSLLALGAVLTVLGLAIAATSPVVGAEGSERTPTQQLAGGAVVLVGWTLLAWGIHRFGRES